MGILIAVLSLIPGHNFPETTIKFADLIVHLLMYATWVLVIYLELNKQYTGDLKRFRNRVLFIVILFGIIIEVLQEFLIPGRFGSVSDVLANTTGATSIYLVYLRFYNLNK